MKIIARILHLPSVVQSDFYEATGIFFCMEIKQKYDFIQKSGHKGALFAFA